MSAKIEFGKIKSLEDSKDKNGDETMAIVVPEDDSGSVTRPLIIPFYWRKKFGNIQVGDRVVYSLASNNSGCIIARVDGEWDSIIRNEKTLVQINGNTATKGNVLVEGNSDIIGNLNADGDVCINNTIEAKGGNLTIDGTQIKMNGMTATGAKPFNGFPGGNDTFTGAPVSQDTVNGNGSLAGGNAANNKDSYYSGEGGGSAGGSSGGGSSGGDSGSGGGSSGGGSESGGGSSGGSSGGGMTEAEKAEINGKIETLQGKVDEISASVETLNGTVENQQSEIETLKGNLETVSGNVDNLQADVSSLKSSVETLQNDTDEYLTNEEIDTIFEE